MKLDLIDGGLDLDGISRIRASRGCLISGLRRREWTHLAVVQDYLERLGRKVGHSNRPCQTIPFDLLHLPPRLHQNRRARECPRGAEHGYQQCVKLERWGAPETCRHDRDQAAVVSAPVYASLRRDGKPTHILQADLKEGSRIKLFRLTMKVSAL